MFARIPWSVAFHFSNNAAECGSDSLADVLCCILDQRCNLLWVRDVDRVAGSGNFDFVAAGPSCVPTFEIGVDDSVASGYQH